MRAIQTLEPNQTTVAMRCEKCDIEWDADAPEYGVDFEIDDAYCVMTESCPECGEPCDLELELEWKRKFH